MKISQTKYMMIANLPQHSHIVTHTRSTMVNQTLILNLNNVGFCELARG